MTPPEQSPTPPPPCAAGASERARAAAAIDAATPRHGTFGAMCGVLRLDLERRLALQGQPLTWRNLLGVVTRPGVIGVVLFRLAEWRHVRGGRWQVKLIELAMHLLSRIEIHAGARIGPGLVLPDHGGGGITFAARIGSNCTFLGSMLLTIGGIEGIDLDTARIVLGDDCVIGHRVRIIGNVTLADGVQIKENSVVLASVTQAGTLLSGVPARRRGVVPLATVRTWSPLAGGPLDPIDPETSA